MVRLTRSLHRFLLPAVLFACALSAAAQVNPDLYSGLQWRNIGPYHGGRIASVTGVIGEAGTFYVGTPQGGIWKTTSAGTTWRPIFDQVTEVDSIGAIAVAPSDPNTIYAGSGDPIGPSNGDGMYKSTDAGKTWKHIGLEGTTRIARILVDPKNPNLVLVAALAGATGTQRGVFRSEDGGQSWTNALHPDDVTGGRDMSSAFDDPNEILVTTIYDGPPPGLAAAAAAARGGAAGGRGPIDMSQFNRTRLYKSMDEGKTWTQVTTIPAYAARFGVAVAQNTSGQRVYLVGNSLEGGSGLSRSDDGGQTWKHMAGNDTRITNGQGTYSCGVWVDSQNPDIVYTVSTAAYRSTDGGQTFDGFKGAPGGEDMHDFWIDPTNGKRMLMGTDQGAAVTLDGGLGWSSYYALPIDQVYHISTDNRYPYWVLASQQDTGAVMTRSRGDVGDISEVDWMPLPSSEFGTVTADPLDPNIVYGVAYGDAGGGSGLVKINLTTGQWENAAPNFGMDAVKYRGGGNERPDPFDPHTVYMSAQCLLASHDQGHSWKPISPELGATAGEPMLPCGVAPPSPAPAAAARGGTPAPAAPAPVPAGRAGTGQILDYSVSTLQRGVYWTISGLGQVYNSMDGGKHWNNGGNPSPRPTPTPGQPLTSTVGFLDIDAAHTDLNTAYVAGRRQSQFGLAVGVDTNVPLIWRTHDGGKTWTLIVNGLPQDQPTGSWVNVVREDPKQKGLLFAGTETSVFVSFDDGDHWQPLRNNLPSTSIRDMVFHTDNGMSDLVIGTYGRSFWVLDDTTPLREIAQKARQIAAAPAYFFKPGDAIRARVSDNWDQPLNPELPHALNPPYGAIFYYYLSHAPSGPITLEVLDASGRHVRTISSVAPTLPERWPFPQYWVATPQDLALPTHAGMNRFNWDLRYDDPPSTDLSQDLENQMNVAPGGFVTPGPHGPQVIPGVYTMKLTVDGQTFTQTVTVHNDPRVGESPAVMAALRAKDQIMAQSEQAAKDSFAGDAEVVSLRKEIAALNANQLPADLASAATALDGKLATFGGALPPPAAGRGGVPAAAPAGFQAMMQMQQAGSGRGAPGVLVSFPVLTALFDRIVSVSQVGLDEAPTEAEIDSWQGYCGYYNATVAGWKFALSQDVASFNAQLTKAGRSPLQAPVSALAARSCAFAAPQSKGSH